MKIVLLANTWLKRLRLVFILSLIVLVASLCASGAKAESNDFSISTNFKYILLPNEGMEVRGDVTLLNRKTESYAPFIDLDFSGFEPKELLVYQNGKRLSVLESETKYRIMFSSPSLGMGSRQKFTINFKDESIVHYGGNSININLPRQAFGQDSGEHNFSLELPPQVQGNILSSADYEESYENNSRILKFLHSDPSFPVRVVVGDFQKYDFRINLTKNEVSALSGKVAIPSSNSYQKVVYSEINPKPRQVTKDIDGNWIADFSDTKSAVTLSGVVIVFPAPQEKKNKLTEKEIMLFTKEDKYWERNDKIKALATELHSIKDVYDYVVNSLQYRFDIKSRVSERKGAQDAINSTESICREFTDLFIALARAKGVPAREINGFTYTKNSPERPSDIQGGLHSWPEYYDFEKKAWIQVDPTWTKTTGGVDYFNQFDVSHIGFVVRGASSVTPITTGTTYPKDGTFVFTKSETKTEEDEKVDFSVRAVTHLFRMGLSLSLENNLGSEISEGPIKIESNGKTQEFFMDPIPPYGKIELKLEIDSDPEIKVIFKNQEKSVQIVKNDLSGGLVIIILGVIALIATAYIIKKLCKI